MNLLSKEVLQLRAKFLYTIRKFFYENNYLEIDTPAMLNIPGMEPHLDPFLVSSLYSAKEGYLITSPEYSLKQALSMNLEKIFEIAHCFRSGEKGSIHTREFLMLEFYHSGINEMELMDECILLLEYLNENFLDIGFQRKFCTKVSMEDLFYKYTNRGFSKNDLVQTLKEYKLDSPILQQSQLYEDYFYTIFLNLIEPNLPQTLIFVYDYPEEQSSLAKVIDGKAKRFEMYWNKTELGNAFYELTDRNEQIQRFKKEQMIRKELGKEVFPINSDFDETLTRGIPEASGISIGLDRLFMIFLKLDKLKYISPYFIES